MQKIFPLINKLLFTIITTGIVLTACKKYLDPTPVSSFDPAFVFDNVINARAALLGAYQNLAGSRGYGLILSLYYPYDNDEMMGAGGSGDGERRDLAHYNATSGNASLEAPYNQLYNGVERANLCIYYIPKMELYNKGTAIQKAQLQRMYGEALTLRAQFYFELTRNWGDVPAQWLPSAIQQNEGGLFLPKTDRDTIYEQLLSDLLQAESLVPWRTEVPSIGDVADERITKGAVKALRAKIALFRGGYSLRRANRQMERRSDYLTYYKIARDECDALMQRRDQHTLLPGYKALFRDNINAHINDAAGELILQVACGGGIDNMDSRLAVYNGPAFAGVGGGSLTILPMYLYLFDSTDVRRDVTIAPYTTNTDRVTRKGRAINQVYDGKFRRDWLSNPATPTSSSLNQGLNWPLIRFSDVLLMFAETENELNGSPTAAAIAAFQEVSTRGHGGDNTLVPTIPADKTGFFQLLIKERALEFGGEGIRKYDLIRWNLLGTALNETIANLKALAAKTAMTAPTYMAPPPPYCLTAALPTSMYSINTATADDSKIWYNSFYTPAPTSTPSGTSKVSWIGAGGITTSFINFFAVGFKANHNELYPIPQASIDASNGTLTQDYGY